MDDYPDKTRLFHRPGIGRRATGGGMGPRPVCFDLLGFTHSWARSRRGYWLAKRKTASDWLNRAVQKISDWCRRKLWRHHAYYGITGNGGSAVELQACRRAARDPSRVYSGVVKE